MCAPVPGEKEDNQHRGIVELVRQNKRGMPTVGRRDRVKGAFACLRCEGFIMAVKDRGKRKGLLYGYGSKPLQYPGDAKKPFKTTTFGWQPFPKWFSRGFDP